MPLPVKEKSVKRIVDRTLLSVHDRNKSVKRLDIIDLCWILSDMGVELIEINAALLKTMGRLPAGLRFLYRAGPESDDGWLNGEIRDCLIHKDVLKDTDRLERLKKKNIRLTAEFTADKVSDLYGIARKKNVSLLDTVRITGLGRFVSGEWLQVLRQIKEQLGVGLDICPVNDYSIATAIAVEALLHGADGVSASFGGYGPAGGYAALEEILVALKVLMHTNEKMNLTRIPELSGKFCRITGVQIPGSKPVAGKDIFRYESGIHADGIGKNPSTYEPYEPEMVGQKRKLSIGKHSGTKAIVCKLAEMGLKCTMEEAALILKAVRAKSARLKRDLPEKELKDIFDRVISVSLTSIMS